VKDRRYDLTHEHSGSVLWELEMGCMAKNMRLQSHRKHLQ